MTMIKSDSPDAMWIIIQKFQLNTELKASPRFVMRVPIVREVLRNKVRQQMGWGRIVV